MTLDEKDSKIAELLEQNNELIKENHTLIAKLYRASLWGFWIRVAWFLILIGLPFALYFYILEPYFTALGASYDTFNAGIQEIPGLKQFNVFFDQGNNPE